MDCPLALGFDKGNTEYARVTWTVNMSEDDLQKAVEERDDFNHLVYGHAGIGNTVAPSVSERTRAVGFDPRSPWTCLHLYLQKLSQAWPPSFEASQHATMQEQSQKQCGQSSTRRPQLTCRALCGLSHRHHVEMKGHLGQQMQLSSKSQIAAGFRIVSQ